MKKRVLQLFTIVALVSGLTACENQSSNEITTETEKIIENVIQDEMTINHNGEGFGIHDFSATYTDYDSGLENVDVEITMTKLGADEKSIDIIGIVSMSKSTNEKYVNGIYELDDSEISSAKEYFTIPEIETEEIEEETEIETEVEEAVNEKKTSNDSSSNGTKEVVTEQPTAEQQVVEQQVVEQQVVEQPEEEQPQPEVTCGWAGPGWQSGYINPGETAAVTIHDATLGGDMVFYAPQMVLDEFAGHTIKWLYWGEGTGMVCWGRTDWASGEPRIDYFSGPDGNLIKKRTSVPDPAGGNGSVGYEEYY